MSSMDPFDSFWVHEIVVTPADAGDPGTDDYGRPITFTPFTVHGWVEESRTLATTSDGTQVTSTATIYLPWDAPTVPVGSTVRLPDSGRDATVLTAAAFNGRDLDLPSHRVYQVT